MVVFGLAMSLQSYAVGPYGPDAFGNPNTNTNTNRDAGAQKVESKPDVVVQMYALIPDDKDYKTMPQPQSIVLQKKADGQVNIKVCDEYKNSDEYKNNLDNIPCKDIGTGVWASGECEKYKENLSKPCKNIGTGVWDSEKIETVLNAGRYEYNIISYAGNKLGTIAAELGSLATSPRILFQAIFADGEPKPDCLHLDKHLSEDNFEHYGLTIDAVISSVESNNLKEVRAATRDVLRKMDEDMKKAGQETYIYRFNEDEFPAERYTIPVSFEMTFASSLGFISQYTLNKLVCVRGNELSVALERKWRGGGR